MQAVASELDDGAQTSVPWRLSRSVIDSTGLAGPESRAERIGDAVRRLAVGRPAWLWGARIGLAEIAETSGKAALVLLIFLSRSR